MVRPKDYLTLLSGAWTWINGTSFYPNGTTWIGEPDPALGRNATGMLTYHTSGYVSAILQAAVPEYRPAAPIYDNLDSGTETEWALIGKHNLAYGAPFMMTVFDELGDGRDEIGGGDSGMLVHGPVFNANLPSFIGSKLTRNFSFHDEGKVLRLRTWNPTDGVFGFLTWGRLGS